MMLRHMLCKKNPLCAIVVWVFAFFNKVAKPGGVFASWFSSSADVSVSDRLQRFFLQS